jgi:hypothetical protein
MNYSDPTLKRVGTEPEGPNETVQDADRDVPVGERVYAPASQRVPVDPVAGHREVIEHTDAHTPEREARDPTSARAFASARPSEPAFTRVVRPSVTQSGETSTPHNPTSEPREPTTRRRAMFKGIGFSGFAVVCSGVGAWLFIRWRNERNKPINRFRRQARQAALEIRGRVPKRDEAFQPAMGLTAAVLPTVFVLWRKAQSNSRSVGKVGRRRAEGAARRAGEVVSDVDWQKRLMALKERWSPSRLELEKISISRH